MSKQLVLFHLNDIDPDVDIWPWGGEPLYRNDEFVGTVTSAGCVLEIIIYNIAWLIREYRKLFNRIVEIITRFLFFRYGFNADKLICLGYIHRPKSSKNKTVTADYILEKEAKYQIDIAGNRFAATPYLHAPTVGNFTAQDINYKPTVIKY